MKPCQNRVDSESRTALGHEYFYTTEGRNRAVNARRGRQLRSDCANAEGVPFCAEANWELHIVPFTYVNSIQLDLALIRPLAND